MLLFESQHLALSRAGNCFGHCGHIFGGKRLDGVAHGYRAAPRQRARFKMLALWVLASGLVYFLYFYGFTLLCRAARTLGASLTEPLTTLQYFFTLLGAPVGTNPLLLSHKAWASSLFCFVSRMLCSSPAARRLPPPNEWGALGLVIFGLLIGGLITVGRSYLDVEQALLSRYTSITALGVIGVYIWGATLLSRSSWSRGLDVRGCAAPARPECGE